MANQYSDGEREDVIQLLLDGKTPEQASEITGINKNTIIWWRTNHKRQTGITFPSHHKERTTSTDGPRIGKELLQKFLYTDEEIIELVRINPGFGIDRFVKIIYPRRKSVSRMRYRITMLLNDHCSVTGEDLYELLQSPDYSTLVSEREYKEITGERNVPRGQGRAAGGRTSKLTRMNPTGTHGKTISFPPQEFNWGETPDYEERKGSYRASQLERVDTEST